MNYVKLRRILPILSPCKKVRFFMDSLLFSAPFSKGAFGVFWTGFVDSARTGVSFVAKLWCRLRYVLFTPEFLVDKSQKMWHNTMRGCVLRAVQYTAHPPILLVWLSW